MTINIDKIFIDSSDRSIYDKLEKNVKIKGHTPKRDLFLFALSLGLEKQQTKPIEKKQEFFWTSDLGPENEMLFKAIAIHKAKSETILEKHDVIVQIVQEYAHGGIQYLNEHSEEYKFGSFFKHIENNIDEKYKKIGLS